MGRNFTKNIYGHTIVQSLASRNSNGTSFRTLVKQSDFLNFFRQVIVGEHTLAENPDCVTVGNFCLPNPQKFRINKVTQHQNWDAKLFQDGYDIALVRIIGEIKLFVSMYFTVRTLIEECTVVI